MSITVNDVQDGTNAAITNLANMFPNYGDWSQFISEKLVSFGTEEGIIKYFQTQTANMEQNKDRLLSDPSNHAKSTIKSLLFDWSAKGAIAVKDYSMVHLTTTRTWVQGGMTISESISELIHGQRAIAYVDKVTGQYILNTTQMSSSTAIPYGKVLSSLATPIAGAAVLVSYKDAITSAWDVAWGTEADALLPFKHYTIASASLAVAASFAAMGAVPATLGIIMGGFVAYAVADTWDKIPEIMGQCKLVGKSVGEFWDILGALISETVNDILEATGQLALDILDGVQAIVNDVMNAASEIWQQEVINAGHLMLNVADLFGIAVNTGSPLVLDLEGNGLNLVASDSADAVYWDIDANGFRQASGWVGAGMGLLAIDLDQNGSIDNNSELFGNQPQNGLANGFQTLAAYDSNQDGVIDSNDTQFGDLLVWIDANGDGVSQASELHSLASLNITSINLNYTNVNYAVNGNTVKQESSFVVDGQSRLIADVWFSYSTFNTVYDENYELSPDLMFLPTQRGYGEITGLHIAMSQNEDLLDMVAALATKSASDLFASNFDLKAALTAIMYEWAGVTEMDPEIRGTALDARMISFLEKLNGFYFGNDPNSIVAGIASGPMREAWNAVFNMVATHFLAQSGMRDLLGNPFYDLRTDNLSGGYFGEDLALRFTTPFPSSYWLLNDSGFNDVYVFRAGDTPDSFGLNIYETINTTTDAVFLGSIDPENVRLWTDNNGGLFVRYTSGDSFTISASKHSSGASRVGEYVEFIMFDDGTTWDLREGLHLRLPDGSTTAAYGTVYGDIIEGGSGTNHIYGYAGNDTLIGHGGDDYLFGGTGNDTYVFKAGDGLDTIFEYANEGTDTIRLEGIATGDVYMWSTVLYGSAQLVIQYGTTDKITVANGSYSSGTGATVGHIEQIVFDDNTVWDLTGALHMRLPNGGATAYGTAYGDTIEGGSSNDWIYGEAGNDTLIGNGGNDYLYGGAGDDFLSGGSGSNYLTGGAGADTFYFDATALGGSIDTITDFSTAQGDVIDIRDVLDGGYDPLTDNLADFVKFTGMPYSVLRMSVDLDGAGTEHGWTAIADLSGLSSLPDVDTLVANGNLLAA